MPFGQSCETRYAIRNNLRGYNTGIVAKWFLYSRTFFWNVLYKLPSSTCPRFYLLAWTAFVLMIVWPIFKCHVMYVVFLCYIRTIIRLCMSYESVYSIVTSYLISCVVFLCHSMQSLLCLVMSCHVLSDLIACVLCPVMLCLAVSVMTFYLGMSCFAMLCL